MKVKFITLGCKTNQYETNAMEQNFNRNNYKIIHEEDEKADIFVINTCSVTNIAERKSRQMIRRVKELNPNAIIVATGCYAQVGKNEIEKIPEVNIILGINEKNRIVEIVEEYIKDNKLSIKVSDVMNKNSYEDFGTTTYNEQNRAVVKIQDGCDRFCSYCIIPYARGKVRSRKPESILKEIKEITQNGIKEIVLTGIHIASYGKDFNETEIDNFRKEYGYAKEYEKFDPKADLSSGGFRLIELLEQINKIESVKRIRIGSLEPKLITEKFVERLSKLEKMCDHFHLSLQSGCNETLKRMNRRYTTEEFKKSVNLLRNTYPKVALTTDIIVGFPGETDEEFENTYNFLKEIKFYKMHIFKYSPRKGTKAIEMPNQVNGNIKETRSQRLIELSNKNEIEYNNNYIGKTVSILFEGLDENDKEYFKGHTTNYMLIKVRKENNKIENIENQIRDVKIIDTDGLDIIGEILTKERIIKCQEQN